MILPSTATSTLLHRHFLAVRSFSIITAILIGSFSYAICVQADSTQTGPAQASTHPVMSVLDGKTFSGVLGGPGITPGAKDTVVFQDGMFLSERCQITCGYTDGPYWVRSNGDGVQFTAETPCLKADASIVWTGTVKDGEIEGTFTWTSERWYWTVEKEFSFKGKLIESNLSATEQ